MKEIVNLKMQNNKLSLCFSGGYDSTALLLSLLEQGCKDIECFYIDLPNNENKSRIEQKRCKKILKVIKKVYKIIIPFRVITCQLIPNTNNMLYGQPYLFITSVIPVMDVNTDYLLFGYHQTDGIWHVYNELCESYSNLCSLYRYQRANQKENKSIIYSPLELCSKSNIVNYVKKRNKKIFKLCWTCEDPQDNNKPCGKCTPCKNLKEYK